ncbi:MAG: hypothetical protein AABY84_07590 [Candidatus Firestonebacteria bacterium]
MQIVKCKVNLQIIIITLIFGYSLVWAEPFVLQQAQNVLTSGEIEIGADFSYSEFAYYKEYKLSKTSDILTKLWTQDTQKHIPVLLKWGMSDYVELAVSLDAYSYWKSVAIGQPDVKYIDIGNGNINIKYNFCTELGEVPSIAIGTIFDIPTTNSMRNPATASDYWSIGINFGPFIAISKEIEPIILNLNFGYKITNRYRNVDDKSINPVDYIFYGIGAELPIDFIDIVTEAYGTHYTNKVKTESEVNDVYKPTTLDLITALRCKIDNFKIKFGLVISISDVNYKSYDWKIVSGISCIL